MTQINLGDIRYNATAGAFEARVDIERGGTTYRYPCQVSGPMTMEPEHVRNSLTRHAMRMSDSGTALLSKI